MFKIVHLEELENILKLNNLTLKFVNHNIFYFEYQIKDIKTIEIFKFDSKFFERIKNNTLDIYSDSNLMFFKEVNLNQINSPNWTDSSNIILMHKYLENIFTDKKLKKYFIQKFGNKNNESVVSNFNKILNLILLF